MDIKGLIKQQVGIMDLLGNTKLERTKDGFTCQCPFPHHNDRTPSFSFQPDTNKFNCFGCKASGGDVIDFVQKRDGVDFNQALKTLEAYLHNRPKVPSSEGDRYAAIMSTAMKFYQRNLRENPDGEAQKFLNGRGIEGNTAKYFRLGATTHGRGWDPLYRHLKQKGFTDHECLDAKLVKTCRNGNLIDALRDRLIFPILGRDGIPRSFVGRALEDGEKYKYLNLANSDRFKKGEHMINMHSIQKDQPVLIVEGPIDAVTAFQTGFQQVGAVMQSNVTKQQVQFLAGFTKKAMLCLDADQGGDSGRGKSIKRLLEAGISVKISELPKGQDPDEMIRENGAEAFKSTLEKAVGWYDFLLKQQGDLNDPDVVDKASGEMAGYIKCIASPIERILHFDRLSKDLNRPLQTDVDKAALVHAKKAHLDDADFDRLVKVTEANFGFNAVCEVFHSGGQSRIHEHDQAVSIAMDNNSISYGI